MTTAGDSQVYHDLMRLRPDGLTPNGWAVKAGVSRAIWADMRRHGNPSRRTLEKLLTAAGSSLAEFEALRVAEQPNLRADPNAPLGVGDARASAWRSAPLAPLPLHATAMAGEWGGPDRHIELTEVNSAEIVERLLRPASLAADRDAYALTIVGDSMWPRFRPGRRIIVSPKAPVAIGDDVVVQLCGTMDDGQPTVAMVLIKELVRRTAGFVELRQFTPDVSFPVESSDIAAIHKVVGEVF